MKYWLVAPDVFREAVKMTNHIGLNSPDALLVLLTRFASMALSMVLESTLLGLPDLN